MSLCLWLHENNGKKPKKGVFPLVIQLEKTEITSVIPTAIVTDRKILMEGMKKLSTLIDGRSKINFHHLLKIETTKEHVILSVDSNAIGIVKIENHFNSHHAPIVVHFKALNDFLKKTKSDIIEIEQVSDSTIRIKANKIKFNLEIYDTYLFPSLPNLTFKYLKVDATQFKKAMQNVLYAVAKSESRPMLTSVDMSYENGTLNFVGCDSHRLGFYKIENVSALENDTDLKINPQGSTLEKVVKLIDKNTKFITLGFNDMFLRLNFGNDEYWIKNVEGNYPDTSRLIPTDFKSELTLNKKEVTESLETLKLIENHVTLEMDEKENLIIASEVNELNRKIQAELDYESVYGDFKEIGKIGFNRTFIADALKCIDNNQIEIKFTDKHRPFTITDKIDPSAIHLILPIRLK